MQIQLLSSLPATAGLNLKAYRTPSASSTAYANSGGRAVGVDTASGRSAQIIDGEVLRRWTEMGSTKRVEVAGKGGYDGVEGLRNEVGRVLGWSGLDYF